MLVLSRAGQFGDFAGSEILPAPSNCDFIKDRSNEPFLPSFLSFVFYFAFVYGRKGQLVCYKILKIQNFKTPPGMLAPVFLYFWHI